ncbi:MAG: hypothetical protein HUU38_23680 [Anaerolineales bacterium]|nr:hypothetical protein [Anaerolineales bacterium]
MPPALPHIRNLPYIAVFSLLSMFAAAPAAAAPPSNGTWLAVASVSDEFNAGALDLAKWTNYNASFLGNPPGIYVADNVDVNNGKLELWATAGNIPGAPSQYWDYQTSYVASKQTVLYGYFEARAKKMANVDRVKQTFIRTVNPRMGLVYYPLYVLRYLYRGRSFQVAVDGLSGRVLYGKAPGNTWYRAGIMVAGMALGAFLIVDVCALVTYFSVIAASADDDALGGLIFAGLAVLAGVGAITAGYRRFRYGEVFEYRALDKLKRRTDRRMEGGVHRAREIQSG